jgi:hypothetical protein
MYRTYDDDVLVLNNGNFKKALEQHKYLLVEFYAPWYDARTAMHAPSVMRLY